MKKSKLKTIGPGVEIIFLIFVVSILSLFLFLFKTKGYQTEPGTFKTSLMIVNNVFSSKGIKHILDSTFTNFQLLEPLVLIILSLIAISILEASGLLKQIFLQLKKIKPKYVTMLVMFVGIISTIIGDYSYALLIPISGILYKYIGRDSSLGVLTMFIAITIGYGTGLIYNYQAYQLGNITEISALGIVEKYNYELLSNIFFMIVSTVALTIVGTIVLERMAKKYRRNEEMDNLNTSKKAAIMTLIVFIVLAVMFIYCIIPGLPKSGLLLDKTEPTYIGKLFGSESTMNQGFMFLIILVLMVCGFVYGKISKNIKTSNDYSKALTKTFENTGTVFSLLFFYSVLSEIIDWTNLSKIVTTNIVDFVGTIQLSGLMLLIIVFLSIVLISVFIPQTMAKWELVAPIYVPLLLRANISPAFTQTLFMAADSIGKFFSPIYIYLIITIGFMHKYDKESTANITGTMKKIIPIVLLLSLTWIVIVFGWYLIGLPIGINSNIAL